MADPIPATPLLEPPVQVTPVLEAVDVEVHFGPVRALEGATLALAPGRIVALVGESGSGKTTLARTLALVQKPTAGEVRLAGEPVKPGRKAARRAYAKRVQMVLQDPFSSLNPLHRVRYLLERPLQLHGTGTGDLDTDVRALLERVRLTPVDRFIDAFPHELSGGQRQRVAIARALAVRPDVLLGDEPVSMLDVSIRLEVLNLLARLRDEEGTAMLYITHDIAGARYIADEIVVMYAGEMVEQGTAEQITQSPAHPYTELLLASSPDPDNAGFLEGDTPAGEPPDLMDPPTGCRFHPRCPLAMPICSEASPPRLPAGDGHWTRCWLSHPDHATTVPAAQATGTA